MPSASASVRLAYFSPQRVFAESVDGKSATAKLTALQAEKAKEIESRTARLQSQREALQRSATVLDPTARAAREREIERFQLDLQRFTEDAQAEFLGVQRTVEQTFLGRLRLAVDRVAKDRQLLLVFDADAGPLFWSDPSVDITSDIVASLNAQ